MGLMDKLKGLVKGREKQIKGGIDTVSNQVEKRVGAKHAGKVDDVSDKAKAAVDKLTGDEAPAAPAAATPPVVTPPAQTPPVVTPPADTPPAQTPPAQTPPPQTPPPQTPA